MDTTIAPNNSTRTLILRSDLRQLRVQVDHLAAGDTIHALRNSLATAQGALSLIELRYANGVIGEAQDLLDLAEQRLQQVRTLLAGTRQARLGGSRRLALVAA